jgi:hypothetical protein
MSQEHDLERLRKQLRKRLEAATADVPVPVGDLRRVLDELGRLQQSNDRLRRQNRRVRLKLQRAGLEDEVGADGDAADGAPEPGRSDD